MNINFIIKNYNNNNKSFLVLLEIIESHFWYFVKLISFQINAKWIHFLKMNQQEIIQTKKMKINNKK